MKELFFRKNLNMNLILPFVILFSIFIIHVNPQESSTTQSSTDDMIGDSGAKTIGFPICDCYNGGSCDESTNSCICLPQYSGTFCQNCKKN